MSTPNELQGPMSAEDEFAATVEALNAPPSQEPEQPAHEAPQSAQEAVPRDEQGRFAPRENGQQASPQAEKEPFEGFSTLPPDAQEKIRGILGQQEQLRRERDSFRNRFSRANNDLLTLRRSQPQPQRPITGHGRQTQADSGTGREAQPGIAQARADVAAMPQGAERAEATRKLDQWEKHAREYPEDAAAIQQLVGGLREEILGAVGPELEQIRAMRAEIEGFRSVAEQFQHERQQQRNHENQATLDEMVPEWRQLAGWVDDRGNDVPRGQRQWHPAMVAWLDGHDPEVRDFKLQQLGHGSPFVAAEVFREFMADYRAVTEGQQQQANPNAARRQEALRDVAPTGGRTAGAPWRANPSPEDELEAAGRFLEARRNRS